jgi:rod shape determining protein RodA
MNKTSKLKNHDWFMTAAILLLMLIGIVVIYSATFTAQTLVEGVGTVNRQLIFVILGFIIYFLIASVNPIYYKYRLIKVLLFLIIVGLLLVVWLFGDPVRNTNRWIEWGFIRIQPSEYTKIVLIILNSEILARALMQKGKEDSWGSKKNKSYNLKRFLMDFVSNHPRVYSYALSFLISAICIVLILVEPALGNAAITALICLSIFIVSFYKQKYIYGLILILLLSVNAAGNLFNFSWLYERIGFSLIIENLDLLLLFLSIIAGLLILFFLKLKIIPVICAIVIGISSVFTFSYVWNDVLKDYQRERVETFFSPEEDPTGAGWQLRQAKIAIGSGRIFGKGFLQGTQSKLRYLPEAYSDFIFAAFCEEFGLVGALVLFGLYIFLIIRIIKVALHASDNFGTLLCFGVAMMILIHVFINTGMNMGILPITGIPLPLISYGGSSIMVTMIALGFVQAVNMHREKQSVDKSFKFSVPE